MDMHMAVSTDSFTANSCTGCSRPLIESISVSEKLHKRALHRLVQRAQQRTATQPVVLLVMLWSSVSLSRTTAKPLRA